MGQWDTVLKGRVNLVTEQHKKTQSVVGLWDTFKRHASVLSRSKYICGTVGHSFERESKHSYKPTEEECCGTEGHSFKRDASLLS